MNTSLLSFFGISIVLIDTWWNVNLRKWAKDRVENPVLIDTWWNVNASLSTLSTIAALTF